MKTVQDIDLLGSTSYIFSSVLVHANILFREHRGKEGTKW